MTTTDGKTIPKPRIEFFDLAKGICISLIIMVHVGITLNVPKIELLRVPLYFVLSGIFFKEYSGFLNFLTRKTNKILIPLIFFNIISVAVNYLYCSLDPTDTVPSMGFFDLFTDDLFYNAALWFLLCLFWSNILFFFIHHCFQKEWIRALTILISAAIGCYLSIKSILLPVFLSPVFTSLPFFYLGYILKKTPLLYKNKKDRWNIPVAIVLMLLAFILPDVSVDLRINEINGNVVVFYIASFMMVTALLLICKTIKQLPVFSYLGRYSIIVLGTHILLRDPLFFLYGKILRLGIMSPTTAWLTWGTIIAAMFLIIPLCRKVFPHLTAQKDLLPVNKW